MKITLFGGVFDPPHIGHIRVAKSLLKQEIADEVWFVPVYKHPWAERYQKLSLTDYDVRCQMLSLVLENKMKIVHYRDVSFTYPTLRFFEKNFPEHNFSWVMGSEYLGRFNKFLEGHPGLINYTFYIYPRVGYAIKDLYQNMKEVKNVEKVEMSSSGVKNALKNHRKIENMTGKKIAEFILHNNLYSL